MLPESHSYFQAIRESNLSRIEAFWRDGISVYASTETKRDVLGQAFETKNFELMELALQYGYSVDHADNGFGVSPLMAAITIGARDLFDFFIAHGANVNHVDRFGASPYLNAIATGDRYFIDELLKRGAKTKQTTEQGVNDFQIAAKSGHLDIMQSLLDSGSDINHRDCTGSTALVCGAKCGEIIVVRWLIDRGADIHAKDLRGRAALHWAETNHHAAVAGLLRRHGRN